MSLLFIATALSFANAHTQIIGNWIRKWTQAPSAKQLQLKKEKDFLKMEQQQYNMIDEFAKYSKVQRRINALDEQLKMCQETENPLWKKVVLSHAPQIVGTLLLLILVMYYRGAPLFKLPENIDLMPFNYIISYPNDRNYVSLHFWIMSCNVVARLIKFK